MEVQTADVDGDGNIEISLGVYKTARYHPVCDKGLSYITGIKTGFRLNS